MSHMTQLCLRRLRLYSSARASAAMIWNCAIAFVCVTTGLRISSCSVGGSSSPNHMSGARCAVKNFSGGKGHHLLPNSETTLVVMKDRVAQ